MKCNIEIENLMKRYSDFFKTLLNKGGAKFHPYPFQTNCFENFWRDKSILLQAPTGSGKTWAAIGPFVFAWSEWKNGNQNASDYPRKAIYSLPLRTLANSLFDEVRSKIEHNMPELNLKVTIQTGENPSDPLLEGDIVFTTIDQTLSNILSIPLSLPSKLANINAGAVLSSYLIFDEFHLLDPQRSLNTTISIMKLLKNICPFCLMTATLSDIFLENISDLLNASIIRIEKNEYQQFNFVKKETNRSVFVVDGLMDIDNIIRQHKQKSIVICNTVDRCVEIYKALQKAKQHMSMDLELICVHSRFFQIDRKNKEDQITKKFSENSPLNVILISTQIVEVGLDISCDTMHTEICPINSFLQRIGRCARWGGIGNIFVYEVPDQNYKPYDGKLCESTMDVLVQSGNKNIDFYLAKELINGVLGEKENEIFREIQNNDAWTEIRDCWQRNDKGRARDLIRNINSITVVLLPEGFQTDSLYRYDSLSISPYSLKYKINKLIAENEDEGETPVFSLDLADDNFFDDENLYGEIRRLQPLCPDEIPNKDIIALNSKTVGYSEDYGLDFYDHFDHQSRKNKTKNVISYSYNKDTYDEHIRWMIAVYEEKMKAASLFAIRKIQTEKYNEFDFDEIIKYIIVMHDFGKLSSRWQRIMNAYQKAKKDVIKRQDEYLTHTDFDPTSEFDKTLMKKIMAELGIKKPNHSGVGAFISFCVLSRSLVIKPENNKILNIIFSTILRHHGSKTNTMPSYEVDEGAIRFINKLVKDIVPKYYVKETEKFPFKKYREKDFSTSYVIQFNNTIDSFLYFLLVRILRLCDQKSFEKNPLNLEHSDERTVCNKGV